jgi:sn-glycerol 3-phosphate transport system ATP-binding protein
MSKFVATFIGSPPMNILRGVVKGQGAVAIGDAVVPASDMAGDLEAGAVIDIGLRPEDLSANPQGPLEMGVDFVEELGATQLFHGQVGGAAVVMQAPTGEIGAETKNLRVRIDPDRVHLFDPSTGARRGA